VVDLHEIARPRFDRAEARRVAEHVGEHPPYEDWPTLERVERALEDFGDGVRLELPEERQWADCPGQGAHRHVVRLAARSALQSGRDRGALQTIDRGVSGGVLGGSPHGYLTPDGRIAAGPCLWGTCTTEGLAGRRRRRRRKPRRHTLVQRRVDPA